MIVFELPTAVFPRRPFERRERLAAEREHELRRQLGDGIERRSIALQICKADARDRMVACKAEEFARLVGQPRRFVPSAEIHERFMRQLALDVRAEIFLAAQLGRAHI
ncbi:MAG: hypothetical protein ACOX7Q_08755 [Kiritimatiellia bacterium]